MWEGTFTFSRHTKQIQVVFLFRLLYFLSIIFVCFFVGTMYYWDDFCLLFLALSSFKKYTVSPQKLTWNMKVTLFLKHRLIWYTVYIYIYNVLPYIYRVADSYPQRSLKQHSTHTLELTHDTLFAPSQREITMIQPGISTRCRFSFGGWGSSNKHPNSGFKNCSGLDCIVISFEKYGTRNKPFRAAPKNQTKCFFEVIFMI